MHKQCEVICWERMAWIYPRRARLDGLFRGGKRRLWWCREYLVLL